MNKGGKSVKLYNVLFPVWMLLLFPTVWLVVLPGNFIIDSLVLLIGMRTLSIPEKKALYKRSILKIFCFGLAADLIGAGLLFLALVLEMLKTGDEIYLTAPAVIISAAFIFLFNYLITFKHADRNTRVKLSVIFAVATAPYTFLIPTSWIY